MKSISNEPAIIREVVSDLNQLWTLSIEYKGLAMIDDTHDQRRRELREQYSEIRTRVNGQFLIHAEATAPEINGSSDQWNDLQAYVLRWYSDVRTAHYAPNPAHVFPD